MPFEIVPSELPGPKLLQPKAFPDDRGFFVETYRRSDFMALGIQEEMVQHNHNQMVECLNHNQWGKGCRLCNKEGLY